MAKRRRMTDTDAEPASEYPQGAGEDPELSKDARHSSYEPAEQPEQYPPLGTATVQTPGKPSEGESAPAAEKPAES